MQLIYEKEDCMLCCHTGEVLVKLTGKRNPRKENCPMCHGRKKLTIIKKEKKNDG